MSFKINRGLFQYDLIDHHAVLGIPVNADFHQIRKRYLQVARRLHPDSCTATTLEEKQRASQLLSKIVNPAYEQFSKERNRAEYLVILREMSKRLAQEASTVELKSKLSQELAQTSNLEHLYQKSIQQLAAKQYENLEQVLDIIGLMSEVNLVYLMRQGASSLPSPTSVARTSNNLKESPQPAPTPQPMSVVEQYYRRAQAFMENNNFAQARIELQDALKLEPNNSSCHSLMGVLYLKQNQVTMAKVHINKALQLNPQEPMALKAKKFIDQAAQKTQKTSTKPTGASQPNQGTNTSGGSGLFGGLFGGKKK
ncbi:J domain-containing protein [Gloeocapsopsis dulcis]|uniref:Molecular chaperone DnaJ n=1 Tax=Gloeocapsopsis dulcis AAB1 = 1H9 TaxID=1433147 RepID=A0A6N8FYY0_9CHRO|nr:J domain-containing protein [Gloeocapsopsis dulcis]MUL37337.1 molecular chaperone DnaJ [Gloeocapsopsis dulcis AAB1 = 1H9]WNN88954.1 J domain-containing protein [Gloeocapsopsis dulcis]